VEREDEAPDGAVIKVECEDTATAERGYERSPKLGQRATPGSDLPVRLSGISQRRSSLC